MQIVFGSILTISLLLAINFSGRIAAGQRINARLEDIQNNIATLEIKATALKSELNYINSDAFIEHWAHTEGKMVRPNEILVRPVPGATPIPAATSTTVPAVVSISGGTRPDTSTNWKLWWSLFFDSLPPSDSGG
ncbi:MAG TPA: septum formation initiator family protein [Aggregatilineales bacterium]|nr:septum formation initiator family protein [Aggregatilineales bacterium]